MPTLVGLALVAPVMIPLVLGEEWAASVAPFQALAALSIFYALALMGGQILIAAGHAQDAMNFSGVAMVFFLAAVALAAPYGITYAAAAGGLANLPILPIYLRRLRHHFGIDLKRSLFEQLPCRNATAAMVAIVLSLQPWIAVHLQCAIQLLVQRLTGAATIIIVLIILA